MKKIIIVLLGLALVSGGVYYAASHRSTIILAENEDQGKSTSNPTSSIKTLPMSGVELNSGKEIMTDSDGKIIFYNTEVEVKNNSNGGKTVISKGVDWVGDITEINNKYSESKPKTTGSDIIDIHTNKPLDKNLTDLLDYINQTNAYILSDLTLTNADIDLQYKRTWEFGWGSGYSIQAQLDGTSKQDVYKPQFSKVITIQNRETKAMYCILDVRYLGQKVNDPASLPQALIMESCGKFFGLKGYTE